MVRSAITISFLSFSLLAVLGQINCRASTYFREVSLITNDIVYDPHSDMIYASVPSEVGVLRGNTITPINPYTGALGTSVFISSEPSKMSIADDGSRIYVASQSTNLVTPFFLGTMTPGAAFPIGSGDRRVADLEVLPGDATRLAVSRKSGNNTRGFAFFEDGVQLPNASSDSAEYDRIEFGDDPYTLYGHSSGISDRDFNAFEVNWAPNGGYVGTIYQAKRLLTQNGLDMEYDNGRVYFTNGQILEVTTPGPIGSFNGRGPVEPNSESGRTYFIDGDELKTFSQSTFVPLGSIQIPEMSGSARNLISLGTDGLAFATDAGEVIIARGSLVQGPSADFDENGIVAGKDFLTWQHSFGIGSSFSDGDADGDGVIGQADLAVWEHQYAESSAVGVIATVPEPNSIAFALVVLCLTIRHRSNYINVAYHW